LDSTYDYGYSEGALTPAAGPLGAYRESDSSSETSGYTAVESYTYHYQDGIDNNSQSEVYHETNSDTYGYSYGAWGAFGPGGDAGTYTSTESETWHADYDGDGDSNTSRFASTSASYNSASDYDHHTYTGSGDDNWQASDGGEYTETATRAIPARRTTTAARRRTTPTGTAIARCRPA
jgi:hypothetical protein